MRHHGDAVPVGHAARGAAKGAAALAEQELALLGVGPPALLDMVEVEKAHQLYKQHGLGSRDDAMAMQALHPGWKFDPKRPAFDR